MGVGVGRENKACFSSIIFNVNEKCEPGKHGFTLSEYISPEWKV